jgi:hypothetical protein
MSMLRALPSTRRLISNSSIRRQIAIPEDSYYIRSAWINGSSAQNGMHKVVSMVYPVFALAGAGLVTVNWVLKPHKKVSVMPVVSKVFF